MGRVTVHIEDSMLSALDDEAHNKNISRSQAVAKAIESYISGYNQAAHNMLSEAHNKLSEEHNKLSATEEEVMLLKQELSKLNNQMTEKEKAIESNSSEVMRLKEEVMHGVKLQEEAEHNKDKYEDLKTKYDQIVSENTSRWEETKTLKGENTKLKKDIETAQATTQRLQAELLNKQTEVDRIVTLREELATTKTERDKLQDALKARDEDLSFLRGHLSQLTQTINQLSLPPSQEEAKKKGWWQFWK